MNPLRKANRKRREFSKEKSVESKTGTEKSENHVDNQARGSTSIAEQNQGIRGIIANLKEFIQCHLDLQREKIKLDLHIFLLRLLFLLLSLFLVIFGVGFLCKSFYLLFVDILGVRPFYFFSVLGLLLVCAGICIYYLVFTRRMISKSEPPPGAEE